MRKILINVSAGGFNPSAELIREYLKAKNIEFIEALDDITQKNIIFYKKDNKDECLNFILSGYDFPRDDKTMLECVQKLGLEKSSGETCKMKIVEIPDDVDWNIGIGEYGQEWVYETHRTWE